MLYGTSSMRAENALYGAENGQFARASKIAAALSTVIDGCDARSSNMIGSIAPMVLCADCNRKTS
jgi:hypothetical protein